MLQLVAGCAALAAMKKNKAFAQSSTILKRPIPRSG